MADEPISLSSSLDGVVRALRGPSRAAVGGVFGRWEEAVGAHVAEHVRPIRLDGTTLVVEVDQPGWATQIKFLTPTILTRLREIAGTTVERLEVRVAGKRARP